MNYQTVIFCSSISCIQAISPDGSVMFLPAEDNGTPDYQAFLAWVEAGNTPEPAPIPVDPVELTTEQKLEAAGLTVDELKTLFGLT